MMKVSIRRIYFRQWKLLLMTLCCLTTIHMARSDDSSSTPTILAHPAMFGRRWTPNITANLYIVSWDLCNEMIGQPEYLETVDATVLYGVALYFDPVQSGSDCRPATMAQVAEKKYPTAQYLLVPNADLIPMTKYKDEPDTELLALGTVTMEVGNGMTSCDAL